MKLQKNADREIWGLVLHFGSFPWAFMHKIQNTASFVSMQLTLIRKSRRGTHLVAVGTRQFLLFRDENISISS